METPADLQRKIVELGNKGNKDDPCLALFIKQYGKCGKFYPEDEWMRMCGIFVKGWNGGYDEAVNAMFGRTADTQSVIDENRKRGR